MDSCRSRPASTRAALLFGLRGTLSSFCRVLSSQLPSPPGDPVRIPQDVSKTRKAVNFLLSSLCLSSVTTARAFGPGLSFGISSILRTSSDFETLILSLTSPCIQGHMILPVDSSFMTEAVLRRESDCTYGLIRTCCLVPHHTSILFSTLRYSMGELSDLELIFGFLATKGHVPVVLAKSECRLGVHGMRDDVGCRIIEFNARSIVEEEILSVDRVIDAFQSRSRHTKDFQTQTTRTVFLITLEKIRLICVSRGNIIGLAWFCENALTKMLWQILMDLQGTLDNALRLDMSCSECLSVKIKVVLLHTLHDLFDTLYFLLLVWLDGFYAFCVPSKVGVIGWCAGKAALDYMCKLTKKCPLPSYVIETVAAATA
ncbi:heme-dependent catalase, partial [Aureobasidium melanogenum]